MSWRARAEAAEVLVDVVALMYPDRNADPYHLSVLFARYEQWTSSRAAFDERPFVYAADFADREALLEVIAVDLFRAIERLRWEHDPQASGAAVRAHPKLHGIGALGVEDCPVCQRQEAAVGAAMHTHPDPDGIGPSVTHSHPPSHHTVAHLPARSDIVSTPDDVARWAGG